MAIPLGLNIWLVNMAHKDGRKTQVFILAQTEVEAAARALEDNPDWFLG